METEPSRDVLLGTVLALTEQLSAAGTLEDVAAIVAGSVVRSLGASAAFVAMPTSDGRALEMLSHVRAGRPDIGCCRLELDANLPVVEAWRFGVPIFLGDRDAIYERYPQMDRSREDRAALAALPLEVDGVLIGALNLTFPAQHAFDADDRALCRAVAALCAQALRRSALGEELERVRREFAVTAAHELRTPLAAVYGAAMTLARADLAIDAAQRASLVDMIVRQADRMTSVIDDLRLTVELDAGELVVELGPTDARRVVDDVASYWRQHDGGTRPNVRSRANLPHVVADPARLGQVVGNLVENACKYSPAGSPVVVDLRVEPAADSTATDVVVISVEDRGPGIPEAERSRVLEKFYRGDATHRNGVSGTGLGLYIANRIVAAMGGTLRITDRSPGAGTCVEVRLTSA